MTDYEMHEKLITKDVLPSGFGELDQKETLPSYESAETKFVIMGHESQLVEITLCPGQVFRSEPGAMIYMTDGSKMDVETGGCGDACLRCCCAGESFFRSVFKNTTNENHFLGLSPTFPSKIIAVNMEEFPNGIIFKTGAFLGSYDKNMSIDYRYAGSVAAGCCGGQGFVQNILKSSGWTFFNGGGTIIVRDLAPGEILVTDTKAIVLMDVTLGYSIRRAGGFLAMCCGGEGLTNTKLTGPGRVYMESTSWESLTTSSGDSGNNGGGGE